MTQEEIDKTIKILIDLEESRPLPCLLDNV